MKNKVKVLLLIILLFSVTSPTIVVDDLVTQASFDYKILAQPSVDTTLLTVKDFQVYDGDTADFILDRSKEPSIKARFLLIDAPEMNQDVPYKIEARDRVIALLEQAELIQIEYEGKTKDRYNRDLVHVWVDGILLQ